MDKKQMIQDSKYSPIHKIVETEKGYKIVVGNYLVSDEVFTTPEEADDAINIKSWDILLNTFAAISDFEQKHKENELKMKQNESN